MGMNVPAAAEFPDPGIGLEGLLHRLVAQLFQPHVEIEIALPGQAPIEEHLGGGQNDAAVAVVLDLLLGEIADAHRPHAAIALKRRHFDLLERPGTYARLEALTGRSGRIA